MVEAVNAALAARDMHIQVTRVVPIRRGRDAFNIIVGDVESGARGPTPLVEVAAGDLKDFQVFAGQLRATANGVEIQTPPLKYGYGAALKIPPAVRDKYAERSGRIDVFLSVTHGPVNIGISNKSEKIVSPHSLTPAASPDLVVSLPVADFADTGSVVIRSWEDAVAGVVEVTAVRIYASPYP
jgi:hypothetical protein